MNTIRTLDLPNRFFDDYKGRFDFERIFADGHIKIVKRLAKTTRIEVDATGFADLLSDAEFYAETEGLDVDSVGSGLVSSARAALRRLREEDEPEGDRVSTEYKTTTVEHGSIRYWFHAKDHEAFDVEGKFLGRFDKQFEAEAAIDEAAGRKAVDERRDQARRMLDLAFELGSLSTDLDSRIEMHVDLASDFDNVSRPAIQIAVLDAQRDDELISLFATYHEPTAIERIAELLAASPADVINGG